MAAAVVVVVVVVVVRVHPGWGVVGQNKQFTMPGHDICTNVACRLIRIEVISLD